MPTDWNEVNRVAALYAKQWAADTYWASEAPQDPPWIEERVCDHCNAWYTSQRPGQRFCSNKCRGDNHNWVTYQNQIPAWKLAYQSGMSLDAISKKWNVRKETLHKLLKYYGVQPRDKRKFLKHAGRNF